MRFVLRFGLVVLLSAVPAASAIAQEVDDTRLREIARSALTEMPGLSVAVAREGRIVWTAAFGAAAVEPEKPVTPDTRFRVYSVSKPWTAAAALRLAVAGRLDPDAPIAVASFPDKGVPITAFQLGTHSAGIRHYRPGEADTDRRCDTVNEAVELFADDPLLFSGDRSCVLHVGVRVARRGDRGGRLRAVRRRAPARGARSSRHDRHSPCGGRGAEPRPGL